jgi:hypothetical protein
MTLYTTLVAGQQIPNKHQWTGWEALFSTQSLRHLRDTTIEELLEAVFFLCGPLRGYVT